MNRTSLSVTLLAFLILLVVSTLCPRPAAGQPEADAGSGQTIRGLVTDAVSRTPLPGASVVLLGSDPIIGTVTGAEGTFVLNGVLLGRQSFRVSYVGYEPATLSEILITSGKEVFLTVELAEQIVTGEGATVVAESDKRQPLNEMAVVSARSFSVEETRRYAGGVDDPARMASAFAGVASAGGVQQNALVIRGNSPRGVQWRLEGVEIPNPNHFGGLSVAGGGGLTLFSAQLLSDSDFFTGAFPAEYGNALAGVFDINFRSGNPARREHAVQLGLMGVEAASEGPLVKGKPSTYLFNYRYSTLALLMPLLPTDAGTTYQDLSFKLSFPTRRAGRFEVWGLGGLDGQKLTENRNPAEWESEFWDRTRFDMDLGVGAAGVSHGLILSPRTYLRSTAAGTVNHTAWEHQRLNDDLTLDPNLLIHSTTGRAILSSTLDHKFGARHANRTGATVQQLAYRIDVQAAPDDTPPVVPVAFGVGSSTLAQVFTQSQFHVSPRLRLNVGAHAQHFALTGRSTFEPRAGLQVQLTPGQAISAGYGLHSQMEDLRLYLVRNETGADASTPNRTLDFTKAHHFVLGYDRALGETARLKLEGYYQHLFDVPVIRDSSYSLLNFEQDWTFAEALVNEGEGRNAGAEITVERFLRDGYYYLLTGSLFQSRYRGGDGVWRGSRFDQGYAANLLFGKEFSLKQGRNVLGLNGRLILLGGRRRSPVDEAASRQRQEVVLDERRAFEDREPAMALVDFTATFRMNRRRRSDVVALQVKNALAARDRTLDYNYRTGAVEEIAEGFPLPVLSYKVEF